MESLCDEAGFRDIGRQLGVMSPDMRPEFGKHLSDIAYLSFQLLLCCPELVALFSKRENLVLLLSTLLLESQIYSFSLLGRPLNQ